MNRTQRLLDKLLKDEGQKADAVEYALVAAAVVLTAVAVEATLVMKIQHEFAVITSRF